MKNNSTLQNIILAIFGAGIVIGILFFSGKINIGGGTSETGPTGNVTIWGTVPRQTMKVMTDYWKSQNKGLSLEYVEKTTESLQDDLVNALASGKGPDVFIVPPGQVFQNMDRITVIPFTAYPKDVFNQNFTEINNQLITNEGLLAFPAYINPMIMFYNRDILTNAFISSVPKTWQELDVLIPRLVKRNDAGVIQQAAVALGTGNNIKNGVDLIYTKLLQAKNPIVSQSGEQWFPTFDSDIRTIINWYIQYTQSSSSLYSWNASLPQDVDMFTAGNLAFYFGYPSEITTIRAKNPNLNFSVAMMPQNDDVYKATYGELYSVAVSKVSQNKNAAIAVASMLTSTESLEYLVSGNFFVPTRRSLLQNRPVDNPEQAMIIDSGVISKSFLNPNPSAVKQLINTNISHINSGTRDFSQAITSIVNGFRDLLKR